MLLTRTRRCSFSYTDYGSFEEVAINTAGNSAEMPGNGVYSAFSRSRAGIEYHGNVYLDYYNKSFSYREPRPSPEAARRHRQRHAARPGHQPDRHVPGLQRRPRRLGPRASKNRMWWYGSYRYSVNRVARPNFPCGRSIRRW